MFNSLKDFDFSGKRTIVRCDFNVPIKEGKIIDDFKIQKTLPTLNYLEKAGARIILISHLGRPEASLKISEPKRRKEKLSLEPVAKKLEELLKKKVKFLNKCIGWKIRQETKKLKNGEIILLENLRLKKEEENNNEKFAQALASLGDVYVSEAFSVSHRSHASIVSLPKFLPHFIGFDFQKEIEVLSMIAHNPKKPLCVIIGGAKIDSKIKAAEKLLKSCDYMLFGGRIANVILRVKGISIGRAWPQEHIAEILGKINLTNTQIHLPVDVVVSTDEIGEDYIRETAPGNVRKDEKIFDIGKETIQTFSRIISESKTIFWSGPLGLYENNKFSQGTKEIAQAIARNYAAFKIAGGGDTVAAIRKFGLLDKFSFLSTGGGAMLGFMSGKKLPGIEALES